MLTIRFFRTGKKNQPFFKIVVTDKRNAPRGGRFVELLGFFNPLTKEKRLKAERIKHWISKGAKPSETVHNLLVKEGIVSAKKKPVHAKPKKKENEVKPAEPEPVAVSVEKKEEQAVKEESPSAREEESAPVAPEQKKEEK